jgi:hypothetical protein
LPVSAGMRVISESDIWACKPVLNNKTAHAMKIL